ncbi:glycosyltransferase family 2 protein [Gynurincola endophyticus]|uniref:glycosyltransferase family 2 protein n=1 Tax=Gynurincola endophyticus TaxID=2479004 RepID=UPI000F8DA715|nr:glycosyltransferase family 2 protein [Gynurincola endophyticus]
MKLSVIIVNYNSVPFLIHCLHTVHQAKEALMKQLSVATELIVIDNASTSGDIHLINQYFSDVKILVNDENLGFAKANNRALTMATGNFVLFLNPDTLVQPQTFVYTIEQLLKNEKIGAVGVRMIDGAGRFLPESKRGYPSLWASFMKMSKLYRLNERSSFLNKYYAPHIKEKANGRVTVLSGAFMLVRKNILDEVNGFDERYFMYGEDIDLSVQIEKAGYENWYLGQHTIVHYKGESTVKDRVYLKRFYGAMELFVAKYHPWQTPYLNKILKSFVKIKSGKLQPEDNQNHTITNEISLEYELLNSSLLPEHKIFAANKPKATKKVWVINREEGIEGFIKFLETNISRWKGVYIHPYPFIIESVSGDRRGSIYRTDL